MFEYVEMHKVDPAYSWIEVVCADERNPAPAVIRLVAEEGRHMYRDFLERYMAKQEQAFDPPTAQVNQIEELFEEASMASVMGKQGTASPDLLELLPTNVIHFKYPERTSFRKSRAARIGIFRDEAMHNLRRRDFERCLHRLDWIHLLDPDNDFAFELKVVCLRSWKKMAECVPVFESWIETDPKRLEPRLGLSEMWLYLGQNQKARESFEGILQMDAHNVMALIGLAQAKSKIGDEAITEIRKAWIQDPNYTVEMLENHFDFRTTSPADLEPKSLVEIAETYKIPMDRVMERAKRGVLPMHPPSDGSLLRFSKRDLDRHYEALQCVGLEINSAALAKQDLDPEPVQQSLFDE